MNRPFTASRSTSSIRLSLLGLFAALALAPATPAFAQNPYGGTQNGNQYPVSRGPAYPNGNNGTYGSYNAPNAIPEGTRFIAVLDDKLETQKIQPGKKFKLKLAEDLMAPNGQVIPRGKKIKAHISNVD